ncbi:hypothetical protein Taro_014745 [Colocasia esculenta]|uniref:Uncharacterized protein n=1 Tax=Colocasia esculenta TaxID=4460 RepID=A0A843UFE9_COLES|nr:hypothetical protein [Colocasia esculenta]
MSSVAVAEEELPKIAPIRTAAAQSPRPEDGASAAPEEGKEEEACVTPRSEDHKLKPVLVCPPAPRKPRPPKRRKGAPPQGFVAVPRDLSLVFALVSDHPPKKRIRVG